MYITNKPWVAKIAEDAGINWIFVDMEYIGKDIRQKGLDTVKNHHTVEDVANIKNCLTTSKVIVRINPIHDALPEYCSTEDEIEGCIKAGADIIMLPFFKTIAEVKRFLQIIGGRVKTCLLVETPEAVVLLDEIIELCGIDFIHIGLNDLHLALGMKFMFELLTDGTVERLGKKIKSKGIPFGFGGIATLSGGMVPGSMILKEHVRLGSSMVIVSRSFCNTDLISDADEVRKIFNTGIQAIRQQERDAIEVQNYFINNKKNIAEAVSRIIN